VSYLSLLLLVAHATTRTADLSVALIIIFTPWIEYFAVEADPYCLQYFAVQQHACASHHQLHQHHVTAHTPNTHTPLSPSRIIAWCLHRSTATRTDAPTHASQHTTIRTPALARLAVRWQVARKHLHHPSCDEIPSPTQLATTSRHTPPRQSPSNRQSPVFCT
jgi:hypothetical protein